MDFAQLAIFVWAAFGLIAIVIVMGLLRRKDGS